MRILVVAPLGHMGRLIIQEAEKDDRIEVLGGICKNKSNYEGKRIKDVISGSKIDAPIFSLKNTNEEVIKILKEADFIIDFSVVKASYELLKICEGYSIKYLCGTTGQDEMEIKNIEEAIKKGIAKKVPNTSYYIAVVNKILKNLAAELGELVDGIDIIDYHSGNKKDAPSGTALEMENSIKEGNSEIPVTFHSVRSGNISSSHQIIFGGFGERIEISHHAYDWTCFAKGALELVRKWQNEELSLNE